MRTMLKPVLTHTAGDGALSTCADQGHENPAHRAELQTTRGFPPLVEILRGVSQTTATSKSTKERERSSVIHSGYIGFLSCKKSQNRTGTLPANW